MTNLFNKFVRGLIIGLMKELFETHLRNSKKGLINIKNNNNQLNSFPWLHMRHLNLLKIHPERIAKADKDMVNDLDYEGF